MGSGHSRGRDAASQEKLHTLFGNFSETVQRQLYTSLEKLVGKASGERRVRVLDIGAGSMPYRGAFHDIGEAKLDVVAVDIDSSPETIRAEWPAQKWIQDDFFLVYPGSVAGTSDECVSAKYPEAKGPFDLIILAATLHELYYDCVTKQSVGSPNGFHTRLIRFLVDNLLARDGLLLVADYAWLPEADARAVWAITGVQRLVTDHADPPWTFVSERWLTREVERSGVRLRLSTIQVQTLYDLTVDTPLVREFRNQLRVKSEEEKLDLDRVMDSTARRVGYVATYIREADAGPRETPSESAYMPNLASVHVGTRAASLFREASDKSRIRAGLTALFAGRQELLGDRSAIWHFMRAISESHRRELRERQIIYSCEWEFWLGIGLRQNDGGRFVPRLRDQESGKEYETGFRGPLLEGCAVDLSPGPLMRPYSDILLHRNQEQQSLHDWAAEFHKWLRVTSASVTGRRRDLNRLRSLTLIFSPRVNCRTGSTNSAVDYAHVENPAARFTCLALSLTSLWGDARCQRESGHYVCILHDGDHDLGSLAKQLADHLVCIAKSVVGLSNDDPLPESIPQSLVWGEGQQSFYQQWLETVFLATTDNLRVRGAQEFLRRGLEVEGLGEEECRYRAYSTILLGCDGLSESPPDSVMIFSRLPFPPKTIDLVERMMEDACRRVGQSEADSILAEHTKRSARVEAIRETQEEEQLKRNRAVAGFTHQVGHVLESKSGLTPLRSFADWLVARRAAIETVVGAEEDLDFRAAQTRYACILPRVFANTMEYPSPMEQMRRIWGDARDLKEIINSVWLKLLLPCARAVGRANPTFGTSGRIPELVWLQECGVVTVPHNELVEAILFELFWNPCRHGVFDSDPAGRAYIEVAVRPVGGTAVELTVSNAVADHAACSSDCCPHLRAFVGTLRSWIEAPRADRFAVAFSVENGKWASVLTLPVQPQNSGGVYDDVSV